MKNINNVLKTPKLNLAASSLQAPQLLITGGRAPKADWLNQLCDMNNFVKIIAADHGIDSCQNANLPPDLLIGDGDSASASAWQWAAEQHVPTQKYPRAKDYTDTQLALELMQQANAKSIIITGGFGGRFDHSYSTIFSCANFKTPCAIIDETEAIFFIKATEKFTFSCSQAVIPKAISLIPVTSQCTDVTSTNLRWSLVHATLTQKFPNAISNEALASDFSVSIAQGILGVYFYWGTK